MKFTDVNENGFFQETQTVTALKDFGNVKSGEAGGTLGLGCSLSQKENCWIKKGVVTNYDVRIYGDVLISKLHDSRKGIISGDGYIGGCHIASKPTVEIVKRREEKYEIAEGCRVKALIDFSDVKKGDLGGYLEGDSELSHDGNCWIYDDSTVVDSIISENATVADESRIESSGISGNVTVFRGLLSAVAIDDNVEKEKK